MPWRLETGYPPREIGTFGDYDEACRAWAGLNPSIAYWEASVRWIGPRRAPDGFDPLTKATKA